MNGLKTPLFLLLTLGACNSTAPSNVDSNLEVTEDPRPGEVILAIGEEKTAPGTNLRVRFDRVRTDSRCPIDALCIHAGDAEVELTLTAESAPASQHVLHWNTAPNRPRSATIGGYRVSLEELAPMPSSRTGTPSPDAYRARLKIDRV